MRRHAVKINGTEIGGKGALTLLAGPCVIEDEKSALEHARAIKEIALSLGIPFIYKSSYYKANRSSLSSFRGPGLRQGLKILEKVKKDVGVPVLSDVHTPGEVESAAQVLDIIQIPAFLCRQTDILLAAGASGKPVNVKKGQFIAPWDMIYVVKKIESTGNRQIMLTERGTTFGYNNLVSDFRSLLVMKEMGYPVIFDAGHSVQYPGGQGETSGGKREYILPLAMAAAAVGCDGIFVEVHRSPDKALSDAPSTLSLSELKRFLEKIKAISEVADGA